jgi:hypothetical protein
MYITDDQKVLSVGFNLGCAFLERKAQTVNKWKGGKNLSKHS